MKPLVAIWKVYGCYLWIYESDFNFSEKLYVIAVEDSKYVNKDRAERGEKERKYK